MMKLDHDGREREKVHEAKLGDYSSHRESPHDPEQRPAPAPTHIDEQERGTNSGDDTRPGPFRPQVITRTSPCDLYY